MHHRVEHQPRAKSQARAITLKSAVLAIVTVAFVWSSATALAAPQKKRGAKQQGKIDNLQAEVLVILAEEKPGDIDPELKKIKALGRPPFNSFRSMQIADKPSVTITATTPGEVKLPNGRTLRLEIEQKHKNGKYLISASLKAPEKKTYTMLLRVVAAPGTPFFVAGQKHKGGTLIVGVTLKD